MSSLFAARVDAALSTLEFNNGLLTTAAQVKGAFADIAEDFDLARFTEDVTRFRLEKGGNVWYLSCGPKRTSIDSLPPEALADKIRLPLPARARLFQASVMQSVRPPRAPKSFAEMFWATENKATGGKHIDADEVYTVQLYGSKIWYVDPVRLDWLRAGIRSGTIMTRPGTQWVPRDEGFSAPQQFVMEPGDFLATPAFGLHEVRTTSEGSNLSFNSTRCRDDVGRRCGLL